jgi:hypothetical protein
MKTRKLESDIDCVLARHEPEPEWTCPRCGADAAEIRATGHRRRSDRRGGDVACPEACTCIPEHRSLAEHAAEATELPRVKVRRRRKPVVGSVREERLFGRMRMRGGTRRVESLDADDEGATGGGGIDGGVVREEW